jgi:hypothetical protein
MKTISVKEFAVMPESERAILTYEVLSNMDNGIEQLKSDMDTVKKCATEGARLDALRDAAITKAQLAGEEGQKIGTLANRRIDKIVWAVAAFSVTTLISLIIALVTMLLQRGIKL